MKNSDKAFKRVTDGILDIRHLVGNEQFEKDIANHFIGVEELPEQPKNIPETVNRFNQSFQMTLERTARLCIQRAEELEDKATKLRQEAAILNGQATQIPADLEDAVMHEREMRGICESLALVNPGDGNVDNHR